MKGGSKLTKDCSTSLQIFYQLQLLNKNMVVQFEHCLGTSPSRIEILKQLFHLEEISQSDLQKEINIDHAAITRHLKYLESASLITRRKKQEDNRVTLVSLTSKGREEIKASLVEKEEFIKQTLNGFSEQELQTFLQMLSKISNNVSTVNVNRVVSKVL